MQLAFVYLALYGVALVAITWISSRNQSEGEYLNSNKGLSAKESTWTTFASLLTGYNFVIGVTFSYLYGLWYLMAFVGVGLAFWTLYFFYVKKLSHLQVGHDLLSLGDYFGVRYGSQSRWIINIALCASLLLFLILQMFINVGLFSALLNVGKVTALVLTAGVVSVYLWFGGFRASVKTDIFQGILILPIILTLFFVPVHISIENIGTALDFSQFWFAIGLALLQYFSLLGQAESFQRVFASRDGRSLKRGLFYALILLVAVAGTIAYLGINLKVSGVAADPSSLFTGIVLAALPEWLGSLLLVSLIAAFMGTLDSSSFALGVLLARMHTNGTLIYKIRAYTLAGILVSAVASLYLFSFLSSVFALISLISVLGAALLLSFIESLSAREIHTFLYIGIGVYVLGLLGKFVTENPLTSLIPSGVALMCLLGVRWFVFVRRNLTVRQ